MRISVLTVPSDSGDMLPYATNDDVPIIHCLKPFCQEIACVFIDKIRGFDRQKLTPYKLGVDTL